jgi:hypothetical protein
MMSLNDRSIRQRSNFVHIGNIQSVANSWIAYAFDRTVDISLGLAVPMCVFHFWE